MPGSFRRPLRFAFLARVSLAVSFTPWAGKMHVTRVPFPGAEIDFDAAAVQLDEGAHDRKAKPDAAMARPAPYRF